MTEPLQAALVCTRCGTQNEPRARFCSACGISLFPTLPPTERQPMTRSAAMPPLREIHRADPLIGLVIAERYRVLELIGRGGMGVVYRAEHSRLGKILALKLLTGELTRHNEQVVRFKREALMASRLSHPNTVQVFDFGDADGLAYLAMEYVKGESLGALVDKVGPLGAERTARIVIQICSSLAEAHEKGIVHRDLKPENIMVVSTQGEEVAKVLDFGLAKLRESGELSDVTLSGAIVGTPYYMAPEQIRGEAVGPAADVYALGALMYSCLTGTVVFDAQTPMGVLTRHLVEEPEPPSARAPGIGLTKSFDRIVLSALAKDPARRFESVTALQVALVEELRGAAGQSGVEVLLDRGRLETMVGTGGDAATRDEVERYERKLRRRGHVAFGLMALIGIAAIAGGIELYGALTAKPVFQGFEIEPNNAASEALDVPFPLDAKGRVGQRLDAQRSDRDFYRVSVPAGTEAVEVSLDTLPNMALCAWLYADGTDEPFGRYCGGSANVRLEVPTLRLAPGKWVVAVMQDREAYFEGGAPPVFENVSDDYRLTLKPARIVSEREIEPNDAAPAGNSIAAGSSLTGRLAWTRDVDLLCAAPGAKRVRFAVEDAVERPRSRASVLEVKPKSGPERDIPVRVHRAGVSVPKSPRDSSGAWRSAWIDVDPANPPCIEVTLATNPWAPPPLAIVPPPGNEEYVVRVEAE